MGSWVLRHSGLLSTVTFLTAIAAIFAVTVTSILDTVLAPLPGWEEQTSVAPPPVPISVPTEDLHRQTGLQPPRQERERTKPPPPLEEVRSSLPFVLRGTLVSKRVEWSLAMLEDSRSHKARTVMEGDVLEDARVVSIGRSRVVIERAGVREYIDLSGPGTAAAPVSVAPAAAAATRPVSNVPAGAGTAALAPSLRQTQPGEWTIARGDLDRVTQNMMQLGMDARILPAFEGGVASGFKLMSIKPGSLYSQLGLQNGDVLRRINGIAMDDPAKLLETYGRLKDSAHIELEVDRAGGRVRQSYRVQ